MGWRAGNYGRYETAMRQISACTGLGRRESKWEREDSQDGRVGRDGDGEMVRFLYTTLAKQRRPEASSPCLKWWR